LLYKSKVEYGGWTVNHIQGCAHGCKFPCYAYMMSKRFGRIKDYKEWLNPLIVKDADKIIKEELRKFYKKIKYVHLCFMTDPFMYNADTDSLNIEVKDSTLKVIKTINSFGIPVTVLTKGFYPDEILQDSFLKNNYYGITLVSLNSNFKKHLEPYSAPYDVRISSMKKLNNAGLNTWVSVEPYPTPNIDSKAYQIDRLLNQIKFVKKIIFGKLNYNVYSNKYHDNNNFYTKIAQKVIDFCEENKIELCIKRGTPLSRNEDIFSDLKPAYLIRH